MVYTDVSAGALPSNHLAQLGDIHYGWIRRGFRLKGSLGDSYGLPTKLCGTRRATCQLYLRSTKKKNKLTPRIRTETEPKPSISLRKWQSGPSRGPPGEGGDKNKLQSVLKYILEDVRLWSSDWGRSSSVHASFTANINPNRSYNVASLSYASLVGTPYEGAIQILEWSASTWTPRGRPQ